MWFDKVRKWARKNIKVIMAVDAVMLIAATAFFIGVDEPANAENLTVANTTYNTTELTWNSAEDAKLYRIYRSEDGSDYEYIASTADTHFTDNNIRTGKTYYYAITSSNGLKSSDIDKEKSVTAVPQLAKPELQVDTSKGEMQLNYSEVEGAVGYEISRDGEVIAQSEETSFVDEEASDGEHDYTVKAFRYKKDPVYSEDSNNVAVQFKVISNLGADIFDNDIDISWDKSDYYTNYKVFNGDEPLTETTDNTYKIEDYEKDKVYDIKVIGYTSDGAVQSPEAEKKFEIIEEPMDNAAAIEAAVQWGIHIAADDSFTYGAGRRAHRFGCYFCQTNVGPRKNLKGKSKVNGHSYEKTYCCNPFVSACYAHGAQDPAMLKACRSGHGICMTKKSFTRYGCWKSAGKVSRSNLKRGDVLVRSDHVMMYIGDGQIVQASGGGWDAGSIQVTNLGGRKYSFVMRYTGTGSGVMDVVRDVDENGNVIDAEGNIIKKAAEEQPAEGTPDAENPAAVTPAEQPAAETDKEAA